MLGEDIENERGAVDHARAYGLLKVALLRWRKLVIHDQQGEVQLLAKHRQLLRAPLANVEGRIHRL